jgi:hypothetical protein
MLLNRHAVLSATCAMGDRAADAAELEWLVSEVAAIRAEALADRAELAALKALLWIQAITTERDDDHAPLH